MEIDNFAARTEEEGSDDGELYKKLERSLGVDLANIGVDDNDKAKAMDKDEDDRDAVAEPCKAEPYEEEPYETALSMYQLLAISDMASFIYADCSNVGAKRERSRTRCSRPSTSRCCTGTKKWQEAESVQHPATWT